MTLSITQELVRDILLHPQRRDWSIQGLGMLRTYLTKEVRLHIWDKRFAVAGVSEVHTHPWDFTSYVAAGVVRNVRYQQFNSDRGLPHMRQDLKCGVGACLHGDPSIVYLEPKNVERYATGQCYGQQAHEIHQSFPENGTVTIVQRFFKESEDMAAVFWPYETEWVTAEPRAATQDEVEAITRYALDKWFR